MATADENKTWPKEPMLIPADADPETIRTTFAPIGTTGVKHDGGKPRTDLITWEGFSEIPPAAWSAAARDYRAGNQSPNACSALGSLARWWGREKGYQLEHAAAQCTAALQHFLTGGLALRPSDSPNVMLHGSFAVAMLSLGEVLAFGARKYAPRNWENGIQYSRVYAAATRHLMAFLSGEALDPETRLPHLAHALCCLMFLLTFEAREMKHLDDRPEPKPAGGA